MPMKIERQAHQDTGTGEAKKTGIQTITVPGGNEEPTGEAKSTLNRNVVVESGGPTGEAEPTRSQTITADWPTVEKVSSPAPEPVTSKKTAAKSTSKSPAKKATARKASK